MHFTPMFVIAGIVLIALLVETWFQRRQLWAMPGAFLYVTIFAWYFADRFITPEAYDYLPDRMLETSYAQVLFFLIAYRLLVPWMVRKMSRNAGNVLRQSKTLNADTILFGIIGVWVVLLAWGVLQMNGDIVATLFPIDGRAGVTMWQRGAAGDAGALGFLISTGGYIYTLVCTSFGVLFFLVRSPGARALAMSLMLISWPFFLLSGTRSIFLAVCVPFFFAYFLFSRQPLTVKLVGLAVAFLVLDSLLLTVITYRRVGFREYLAAEEPNNPDDEKARHEGLNMIQELCFVNIFVQSHGQAYGSRYAMELLNVVPRAIWPGKPMLGIDYAVFRGFDEGGDNDIGVVATISTGLIGGGIMNFGAFLGPLGPAVIMAAYAGFLTRLWQQRASPLRSILYLAGLGLTFNLGRDITLLVLWPVVFGYLLTRLVEQLTRLPKQKIVGLPSDPRKPKLSRALRSDAFANRLATARQAGNLHH